MTSTTAQWTGRIRKLTVGAVLAAADRRRDLARAGAAVTLLSVPLFVASAAQASTPSLGWSPSGSYSFGTLDAALGQSTSRTFTLTNTDQRSSGPVTVTLSGSSTFTKTADACTGKRLAPRKSCSVTVKYTPPANGSDNGTLGATSTGGGNASVSLSGASAWQTGDLTSYNQSDWGGSGQGGALLVSHYFGVYASTGGIFDIGDASKYEAEFDSASALDAYVPQSGPVGLFSSSLFDPTSSSAGILGGDAAALKLNIDFADAGDLAANSGLKFGDLTVCGLTSDTGLNGVTVRDFLVTVNSVLGAASTSYPATDLDDIGQELNAGFGRGTPSDWAQAHLVNGSCP